MLVVLGSVVSPVYVRANDIGKNRRRAAVPTFSAQSPSIPTTPLPPKPCRFTSTTIPWSSNKEFSQPFQVPRTKYDDVNATVRTNEFDIEFERSQQQKAVRKYAIDVCPNQYASSAFVTEPAQNQTGPSDDHIALSRQTSVEQSIVQEQSDRSVLPLTETSCFPGPPLNPPGVEESSTGVSGVAANHLGLHNDSTPLVNTQVIPPTSSPPCTYDLRLPSANAPDNSLHPCDSWTGNYRSNRIGAGDSGGEITFHEDQVENLQHAATTAQSVQPNDLHVQVTEKEEPYESGRPHVSFPSQQPTRPERLPSVSVVIPVRRPDKLTTTTTQTNITRKPRRLQGADDHGDNNDAAVHELCYDRPVSSSRSNNEVEGNLRKKHTPSSLMDDAAGACPQSPQKSPDSRFAVTPTEAKEVFGRGVLRIQPYGPRHAYFITFLPDVVQPPSKPSPSELPLEKPSRSGNRNSREQSRLRQVAGKKITSEFLIHLQRTGSWSS
ncbi:uncharacterized protein ATNIH1004_005539 [Aspergillus tanneri]|uniref:Uncharacterized protein n=1 Tax=Aspergillus tanneri TaxID=1220188 RepID=A0A5M9MN55_9EURO|nr:uncharacterized protein ATNIH1004_005539 [Aspergillus tanneri]KAA8646864.1 hypothetical protein ATNIH1004_005539 [Aspergillus tanneri]